METLLVTGGCGFIGSNFVRTLIKQGQYNIVNIDGLTYAARPEYLDDLKKHPRYKFEWVDITNPLAVARAIQKHKPDHIIHLAAESHVCRSISGPREFFQTNVIGTFNLIEEFYQLHKSNLHAHRFHHVSTDEVFGQLLKDDPPFNEKTPISPRSPYAASKASSDHLVLCYAETFGVNVVITNCSNNFGPNQHTEKLIPRTIEKLVLGEEMTVYGPGSQIRDWIHVDDHCEGLLTVFHKGRSGERYCIGGDFELSNLEVITLVARLLKEVDPDSTYDLKIIHTDDRPNDDFRYAIDNAKIETLGWKAKNDLVEENLKSTIEWYLSHFKGNLVIAESFI